MQLFQLLTPSQVGGIHFCVLQLRVGEKSRCKILIAHGEKSRCKVSITHSKKSKCKVSIAHTTSMSHNSFERMKLIRKTTIFNWAWLGALPRVKVDR